MPKSGIVPTKSGQLATVVGWSGARKSVSDHEPIDPVPQTRIRNLDATNLWNIFHLKMFLEYLKHFPKTLEQIISTENLFSNNY